MDDVGPELLVAVVSPSSLGAQIAHEVETGVGKVATVLRVPTTAELFDQVQARPRVAVPLVIVTDEAGSIDALSAQMHAHAGMASSRLVSVTERVQLDDVSQALDREHFHEVIAIPWTTGAIAYRAASQTTRWLEEHLSADPRGDALKQAAGGVVPGEPHSPLLQKFGHDYQRLTQDLIDALERVLGPRPRLNLPAGVRLTHQDAPVDMVFIVVSGTVAMTRSTHVGEVVLHHATSGPMVGILSLASQGRAFVTSTTTSQTEVILLSMEQLDRALREDTSTGEALAALLIRSLTSRLERSEILQVEKIELAADLDTERANLAQALEDLENARVELLAQERFATLGELAAGVAHELNNPTAALVRASEHLQADVDRVVSSHLQAELLGWAAQRARTQTALSTREERARRRALESVVKDRELARRLVATGVEDPAEAARLAAHPDELQLVEAAAGIGRGQHNIELATGRIRSLVDSLHTYVRPDGAPAQPLDLRACLEDALRLVDHRLQGIRVVRDYEAVPPVLGQSGELVQVWTNLLANAGDALHDQSDPPPQVRLHLGAAGPGLVRVRIEDNGPGIAPEVLPHIFEPRFSTKHGQVRYGLGLGMGLAKSVVDAHDGQILVESRPGHTVISVTLPVATGAGDGVETLASGGHNSREEQ